MSIRRMMLFTLGGFFKSIISLFKTRVLSSGGNFEAETNLENQLNALGSDLFNSASLIITPNGYKENLLFAVKPDKVGTNLLQQSETFDNSYWSKSLGTITANDAIAPNGTITADLFTKTSAVNTVSTVWQTTITKFLSTGIYTLSVYIKPKTGNVVLLRMDGSGNTANALFNFTTKTFTNIGVNIISSTYQELPNGWFRLSLTANVTNITWAVDVCNLYNNPTGDAMWIWGAQLESGTTATDYISTTDRAIINGTIGDLTVTRATTATRVNEQGLVETVPYNILSYSEEVENTQWIKSNITIAQNSIISPNGNMTGDKLIEGTNNGIKYIQSSNSGIVGSIHTASIYLKANTRTWAYLTFGYDGSGDRAAYFDLINGVVGNLEGGVTASIVATGNGWYRCTITGTMLNNAPRLGVLTATGNGIRSYLGDGISSIYAWGAQLVKGTEPKPYQLTTNRLNVPRIDYTTGSPAILVEPQRTNLSLQSEDFTNGWTQEGTSVLSNTQIAPDGALTADSIFELTTNDVHMTYRSSSITVTANQLYCASFFVKKNNVRWVRVVLTQNGSTTIWAGAQFDLDTKTFTSQVGSGGGVFSSASITPFVNGWYRISVSGSIPGTSMFPVLALSNGSTLLNTDTRGCPIYLGNVNNELYVWGAQLELGSNITSYMPTTTSAVTRNADNISKTGIINLIGQTEGSIFCEFERTTETAGIKHILTLYGDGWLTNSLFLQTQNNVTDLTLSIRINSTGYSRYIGTGVNGKNKLLLIYDTTGCDIFLNGTKLTRLSLPSFPSLYNLGILHYNAGGRQYGSGYLFSFWKTKLTDQQAIQLTTL